MDRRPFGHLPTGEPVEAHTLRNASGASAEVLAYGGIVRSLRVPDSRGRLRDVVLGFDSLAPYLRCHHYFGALVGRVAGRITGGRFMLDGRRHVLECNDGPNHLHGGWIGFDRRLWSAQPRAGPDGAASLLLRYRSPAGEEGYPGTLDVSVAYTLSAANVLSVETEAVSDQATPFSLAQHSYFNLAGDGGSVADHELQVLAEDYVPVDETMALLGRRLPVRGGANDFNLPRRLGDAFGGLARGHGELYFIRRGPGSAAAAVAARLVEPKTGLGLEVRTSESCLQVYTGSALDVTPAGKSGQPYAAHAGVCLECHGYPDGANVPELGDIILRPGAPRRSRTEYAFFAL